MSDEQQKRCPICDWPLRHDGCRPGDCCYRPDNPAERRKQLRNTGPTPLRTLPATDLKT